MKLCRNCGQQNDDSAQVCTACRSTALQSAAGPGASTPREPAPSRPAGGSAAAYGTALYDEAAMERVRQKISGKAKPKVILFLGHSNSGKSWFIQRVKLHGHEVGYPTYYPDISYSDPSSDDGGLEVQLPTTERLQDHAILDARDDGVVMIDVVGERFSVAAAAGFQGASARAAMLEAIAVADAFVFLGPAGETLYPVDYVQHKFTSLSLKDAQARNMQIMSNVQTVARLDRYFTNEKRAGVPVVDAVRRLREDPALLARVLQDHHKSRKPAMFVLSKADMFETLCRQVDADQVAKGGRAVWAANFDSDPMGLVASVDGPIKGLPMLLHQSFNRFRIEFVAASAGHPEFPRGLDGGQNTTFEVERAHTGVMPALGWLCEEIAQARKRRNKRDFGVAPAIWFRRLINPKFGRAFSKAGLA